MSSSFKPNIVAFSAGAAITKGMAVKKGTDDAHVIKGTANTSRCIGIAQNTVTTLDDAVEVAIAGGGGKGLLSESVVMGDPLVSHTDGSLAKANASGDYIIAYAMQDGVLNDLIDVQIVYGQASAAG